MLYLGANPLINMTAFILNAIALQMNKALKTFATLIFFSTIFVTASREITRLQHLNIEVNASHRNASVVTKFLQPIFSKSKVNYPQNTRKGLGNDTLSQARSLILYCQERPKFILGSEVLITFLLRLKLCQLVTGNSWFDEECAKPLYLLTDYHKTTYNKMCNPFRYASDCPTVKSKQSRLPSTIISSWLNQRNISIDVSFKRETIDANDIGNTIANLTRSEKLTCQSIESYFDVLSDHVLEKDFDNFTDSSFIPFYNIQYTEWFFIYRVFCKNIACGVSAKDYANSSIAFHDCAPENCQLVTAVVMVIDSVITLITVAANLLILTIFFRTSIMKNIPGYFKLSLAFADLGVGLIIMPSVLFNRYRQTHLPLPYRNDTMVLRLNDFYPLSYLNVSGFFGILFVFVSLYTLCAASVDRYLAITRPFKYEEGKYFTKKRTFVVLLLVWLIGAIWAIIPFFINSLYASFGNDFIIPSNGFLVLLYGLCLGIPLIIVWVFNIALILNVRSQYRKRAVSYRKRSGISRCNSERTNGTVSFTQMSTVTTGISEVDCGVQNFSGENNEVTFTK